jgi:hypothetical protein
MCDRLHDHRGDTSHPLKNAPGRVRLPFELVSARDPPPFRVLVCCPPGLDSLCLPGRGQGGLLSILSRCISSDATARPGMTRLTYLGSRQRSEESPPEIGSGRIVKSRCRGDKYSRSQRLTGVERAPFVWCAVDKWWVGFIKLT